MEDSSEGEVCMRDGHSYFAHDNKDSEMPTLIKNVEFGN